jgi:Ser/Thr protein kinase RdoA (MazF antagonist)
VRDLSDASGAVEISSAHLTHLQRAATLAFDGIQEELRSFFDASTFEIVRNSLSRVRDDELVAETYIHGDFHPGNVLSRGDSSHFKFGVSDLENLTTGTAFVDVLYCAIWAQFAEDSNAYWNLIKLSGAQAWTT